MKNYKYLIVGGGMTADAAARGIRELDQNNTIGLLSSEPDAPYNRPNLSKGLWKGRPLEKIWRKTAELGVEVLLNTTVTSLAPANKTVRDSQGIEYTYDKLLLATGCSPNHLPFGEDRIIYFRSLQDYFKVRNLADQHVRFLVIGGGYIGSEIAAAVTMVGSKAIMVFPGDAICGALFPQDLSNYLNDHYRQQGVDLVPKSKIASVDANAEKIIARTDNGKTLEVDAVVAGIGVHPEVELAKTAGLQIEDGILVDANLQTSAPNIYAAGDVANFTYHLFAKRMRVEHEDNALVMGKMAGRNMAGASESYHHAPMFYSDLFKLGYEAVGEMDQRMKIVSDWQEPYQKGVLYYLENDRVRGVLLWNVWKKVDEARRLLAEPGPFKDADLKGRITGQ
jgi:NADPH-dependent 2,4-dienoyl-CoA reductase/sulfur reductase-like enzyme